MNKLDLENNKLFCTPRTCRKNNSNVVIAHVVNIGSQLCPYCS